jgi:hypothetical protein
MKKDVIPRKLTHLNQCRPMDTKLMKKHLYYLLFKNEIVVHFNFFFIKHKSKMFECFYTLLQDIQKEGDT